MNMSLDFRALYDRAAAGEHTAFGAGALVVCDNLHKIYSSAGVEVVALQGLDLLVEAGELVAIVGASGSGKSTLLSILGGLDIPSAGRATVAGFDMLGLDARARTHYRRRVIGFVWQQTARNLLRYLTAAENVELPMLLAGTGAGARRRKAAELLALVGVAQRAGHRPAELSGGEQQRVAVAVALANHPQVLLADEPTGELDTATAAALFDVLRAASRDLGVTILVVTHDPLVAEHVDRTVSISNGRTSSEVLRRTEMDQHGLHRVVAEEFAVLDRAGRVQLPGEFIEALHLGHRVRLGLEPDHVRVTRDQPLGEPT